MRKIYFSLLIVLIISLKSFSQTNLLTWESFGLTGSEASFPSTTNVAGISASTITRGAGLTAAGNANRINATTWTVSAVANDAVTGNDYFEFTVSLAGGANFSVSELVFNYERSSTGPSNFIVRSSIDGFISNIGSISGLPAAITSGNSIPIAGVSGQTLPVTFRIYGYGATNTSGSGGFENSLTVAGPDFIVKGSVVNISKIYTITGLNDAAEPGTPGLFQLTFSPATTASTDVNLTYSGTADYNIDYTVNYSSGIAVTTLPTHVLTVPAGTTSIDFNIVPNNDPLVEVPETVEITINSVSGGYTTPDNFESIEITSEDLPPFVPIGFNNCYTQNFDELANSGQNNNLVFLTGWQMTEDGGGARDNEQYAADNGGIGTGDTYSYGATASIERALGGLASNSLQSTFGAYFINTSANIITALSINYTGEQWRFGETGRVTQDLLDFQYSLDASSISNGTWTNFSALNFITPNITGTTGSRDGNAAANRSFLSGIITGLNITPGQTFFIRWRDINITGTDDGLAVDDLSICATSGLSVNDVTMTEGNSGQTAFNFTVSLSQPAGPGGVTFDIATANNSANEPGDYTLNSLTGQTIPENQSSYTFTVLVNGDVSAEPDETFFVNVTNVIGAGVVDPQGIGTIVNDDCEPTHTISVIQGVGNSSTYDEQTVTIRGVVTGRRFNNGFFVQTPVGEDDGNANTSEGIFVFTGAAPPAYAQPGTMVCVTGKVDEFTASGSHPLLSQTEIVNPTVTFLSAGHPLPAPVTITTADTDPNGGLTQLERYEGMRVLVPSLTVVAPTQGSKNENAATSTSNGYFHGVVTGIDRPFREPGIQLPDAQPPSWPAGVDRWDANPEVIAVSSFALVGSTPINVNSGDVLLNLIGLLDLRERSYAIDVDHLNPPTKVENRPSFTAVPTQSPDELTVASFNLERFFDDDDDPNVGETVISTSGYNIRLNKASMAIRNVLKTPDVIGIVEMESLAVLQELATKISADAIAAGQPDPQYDAYLEEGNDVGGIDVGFLVRRNRVTVNSVTQYGKTTTFTDPNDNSQDILNDRPPLVLEGTFQKPNCVDIYPFTVIVNHLRSLIDVEDEGNAGNRVRAKRRAQAEYLANLIQGFQSTDPTRKIISVGDYNAFQFNDGYVDMMGTIMGQPTPATNVVLASPDLVDPNLVDLLNMATPEERYSYTFDGNAQEIDHILITANLQNLVSRYHVARLNADFAEIIRGDASRPERISDHDAPVSYFLFPDVTPPVLNAPEMGCDVYNQSDVNQCLADASNFDPTSLEDDVAALYHDNCGGEILVQHVSTTPGASNSNCSWSFTYTYSISDGSGNSVTCSIVYAGGDDTAPVLINANAGCSTLNQSNINQCLDVADDFDPNTLEDDVAALYSDNCGGTVTASWTFTAPGPNNTDCSWSFTYHFVIQDECGNPTSCSVTYSGGDKTPPVFTSPATQTIPFTSTCGFTLPAPPTATDNCGGDVSYVLVSYSQVQCGNNLVITRVTRAFDVCGNSSVFTETITVTDNATDFIVYATKDAKFGEDNDINGDVGVTAANGKAEFKKNSVLDPYHVYAKNIQVHMPATVNNKHFVPATGGPNPPFFAYSGGGLAGNHTQNVNGVVPPGNFKNLTIKKNVTATVNGNNYGKVTIEENATVTFTSSTINIEELHVKKGKNGTTNVKFNQCTGVRVKDQVDIEDDTRINVNGPKLIFYMNGKDFSVKADNAEVTANVYSPNGKLKTHGGNGGAIMTGWFIVEELQGDAKNVVWNPYDCTPLAKSPLLITQSKNNNTHEVITDFKVDVAPNPSANEFRIVVNSGTDEPVSIRIFDVSGRTVKTISNATANTIITAGAELRQGTYFAEVIQGNQKQTLKLLKLE